MGCSQSTQKEEEQYDRTAVTSLKFKRRSTKRSLSGAISEENDTTSDTKTSRRSNGSNQKDKSIGATTVPVNHIKTSYVGEDIFKGTKSRKRVKNELPMTIDSVEIETDTIKLKTRFPIWRQYENCSMCFECSDKDLVVKSEHVLNITLQYSSKPILCKTCSKRFLGNMVPNNLRPTTMGGKAENSFANLLALTALDLSVPATDAIHKNRKNAWIQLAGHPGSFAPAGPHTIWKKRMSKENYEMKAYQALMDSPVTRDIIPEFHREVEHHEEYFIEIEDLLQHFKDPNIIDIKMGKRTFLESEVTNPVLRKDLYEKMVSLNPSAPTDGERKQEAITKLRYMQFREDGSSTESLGFRIEAVRNSGECPFSSLKKIKYRSQVLNVIWKFLEKNPKSSQPILDRLKEIREKFIKSDFFKGHEIIGSSLLIMYDEMGNSGVWMIDFAKTIPVENGMILYHNISWQLGNHEDGYLIGLDSLIDVFTELTTRLKSGS